MDKKNDWPSVLKNFCGARRRYRGDGLPAEVSSKIRTPGLRATMEEDLTNAERRGSANAS